MGKTNLKINKLEERITKVEKEQKKLIDIQIIQLLRESNSPFSNKPRYTYSEISEMTNRSIGYISNLANKNGLSRRNLTVI